MRSIQFPRRRPKDQPMEEKVKEKEKTLSKSFVSDLPKDDATTLAPPIETLAKSPPPLATKGKEKKKDKDIDDLIDDLTCFDYEESIPINSMRRKTRVKTNIGRKMPRTN